MLMQCSVCKTPYLRDVAEQELARTGNKLQCSQCKRMTPHEPRR